MNFIFNFVEVDFEGFGCSDIHRKGEKQNNAYEGSLLWVGKGVKEFKDAAEDSNLKQDLKDIASEVGDLKDSVDKVNPKKAMDDLKQPFKAGKKK